MRGSDTNPDKVERIIKLYSEGYGLKHIAKIELGRDTAKNTVRDILMRNGVEIRTSLQGKVLSRDPNAKTVRAKITEIRKKREPKLKTRKINDLPLFGHSARARNLEKSREKSKDYQESVNEAARSKGFKSYYHMRYKTDPEFRLKEIYKSRFNKFVTLGSSLSMSKLIGCTHKQFRLWIESQWEDWMTWDNLGPPRDGYWQIDHVVPCSWFDHSNLDHLNLCWNYQNMRPLCAVKNMIAKNYGTDCITHLEGIRQTPIRDGLIQFAKDKQWAICATR